MATRLLSASASSTTTIYVPAEAHLPTEYIKIDASFQGASYPFDVDRRHLLQFDSVWKDVICLAHPDEGASYEGVPVLPVFDDDPVALGVFLQYLATHREYPLRPFDMVRADCILQIALKYCFHRIINIVLSEIRRAWPTTLECWDRYITSASEADADPCPEISHAPSIVTAAVAVALARKYDFPEIIPYALYAINVQCGALDGDEALDSLVADGLLTESDVDGIKNSRAKFLEAFLDDNDRWKKQLLGSCGSRHCVPRGRHVHERANAVLARNGGFDPLHCARVVYDVQANWQGSPIRELCSPCTARAARWARCLREKIWRSLPAVFAVV